MKRLADAREEEVIRSFLVAERDSPRWGQAVARAVAGRWRLLENPHLDDPVENAERAKILSSYRGYPDRFLFEGFPRAIEWSRAEMTRIEIAELYFGAGQWRELAPTRKVSEAAENAPRARDSVDPRVIEAIAAVKEGDRNGMVFEPLIIVGSTWDGPHVIVEGYTRATAFAPTPEGPEIQAYVGHSPQIETWNFWRLPTSAGCT
jgi:hypothetical protein